MRGYFGVGVERISKAMNMGAIMRTAHAFGASFLFTVDAVPRVVESRKSDTSSAWAQLPFYEFDDADSMRLPHGCALVGVELLDDSVELPSFRHPSQAAYILGPERGSLSPEVLARCDHVVKIPTQFCVNVGIAAAIVMYDRLRNLGRFAPPPVAPGGPLESVTEHHHGQPVLRRARRQKGNA